MDASGEAGAMRVVWTADLATGVVLIDDQHRELFERVGTFLEHADAGRLDAPLEFLHYLGGYVERHFRTEQDLMERTRYPATAAHAREHDEFRKTYGELVSRFARYGEDPRVGESVRREVCGWLDKHVRTTDRELGDYLRVHLID